jgi:hypothetical protein
LLLPLLLKYTLLVFGAVMGVLQAAAAWNDLSWLKFSRYKGISYSFAVLAIGFSLYVFFNWNYRYVTGVIEGAEQAGLFALGSLAALVLTAGLSLAIRTATLKYETARSHGYQGIKQASNLHVLRDRVNGKQ